MKTQTKVYMKVLLFARRFDQSTIPKLKNLLSKLKINGFNPVFYAPFYNTIAPEIGSGYSCISQDELHHDSIDFIFSIGGDGTLLECVPLVKERCIPVIGFNTGRLGFLSTIGSHEIDEALLSLKQGEYTIETRSMVKITSPLGSLGEFPYALNEISIQKDYPTSMLSINVYANDKFLNTYWGDGLLISTPTGSTAYSLSCGGPMVSPDSQTLIITPIAGHNLTIRPIVIPDTSKIRLIPDGRDRQFILGLDSRTIVIPTSTEIMIEKAEFGLKLVRLNNRDFFSTIRAKLAWGLDIRN